MSSALTGCQSVRRLLRSGLLSSLVLAPLAPGQDSPRVPHELHVKVTRESKAKPLRIVVEEHVDVSGWRSRLTDLNIDAREAAFEELVRVARGDLHLRRVLRGWSRAAEQPELAWTARLALRELARGGVGLRLGWVPRVGGGRRASAVLVQNGAGLAQPLREARRSPLRHPQLDVAFPLSGSHQLSLHVPRTLEFLAAQGGPATAPQPGLRFEPSPRRRAPSNALRPTTLHRISGRTVILGVQCIELSDGEAERRLLGPGVGLIIERREPGSVAEAMGLQRGDILVELLGQTLCSPEQISRVLDENREEFVTLKIVDRHGIERVHRWVPADQK